MGIFIRNIITKQVIFSITQQIDSENIIKITAQKFDYKPPRIVLKKGVPITLELNSLGRIHGFHIPALNLRADVLPGQSVQLDLLPEKAGTYTFLCEIFCGGGHDEMNGVIIVQD